MRGAVKLNMNLNNSKGCNSFEIKQDFILQRQGILNPITTVLVSQLKVVINLCDNACMNNSVYFKIYVPVICSIQNYNV
jgi:hypothetical protein